MRSSILEVVTNIFIYSKIVSLLKGSISCFEGALNPACSSAIISSARGLGLFKMTSAWLYFNDWWGKWFCNSVDCHFRECDNQRLSPWGRPFSCFPDLVTDFCQNINHGLPACLNKHLPFTFQQSFHQRKMYLQVCLMYWHLKWWCKPLIGKPYFFPHYFYKEEKLCKVLVECLNVEDPSKCNLRLYEKNNSWRKIFPSIVSLSLSRDGKTKMAVL